MDCHKKTGLQFRQGGIRYQMFLNNQSPNPNHQIITNIQSPKIKNFWLLIIGDW